MENERKKDLQNPIAIVKKKLWKFGYSVKDFSENNKTKYDILVEEKYRVKIGFGKPVKDIPPGCDVFALVDGLGQVTYFVEPNSNLISRTSPYEVFGRLKN